MKDARKDATKDTSDEVTAAHAATLTGLSERTIRRKIAAGEIPARHVARNRYAIRVGDLPIRQSPHDLLIRLEVLEHRMRLIELQYAGLVARGWATDGKPEGMSAQERDAQVADATAHTATESDEIQQLLEQLARETQRLAPLMTALMTGQPSPTALHDLNVQEGPTGAADRNRDAVGQ